MNDIQGNHKPTFSLIFRLLVFSIGIGFSFLGVMVMLLLLVGYLFYPPTGDLLVDIYPLLNTTIIIIVVGALMVPGLVISLLEIFHQTGTPSSEKPATNRMLLPNLLLLGWMIMMGLSFLLIHYLPAAQWLLPVLQVPAILIPVFWLYRISTRSASDSNAKRNWNLLGLNLGLQPIIVVVVELAALFGIIIVGIILISSQPDLMNTITDQLEQLSAVSFNMATFDRIITPYLEKPVVMFTILFYIAGLVPLMEELVKPMLVLRWMKHPLSESQGFLIGLIGGSAFALWENMSALGNVTTDSWFVVVIARYGTSILHMSTAALMGWAWMKSFHDQRFLRTAGAYLLAIILHGAWNFFTMLEAFSSFSVSIDQFPMNMAAIAPMTLVAIVLIGLAILLFGGNRIIRQQRSENKQPPASLNLLPDDNDHPTA